MAWAGGFGFPGSFYFGILNFPVPERIDPPTCGSESRRRVQEIYFPILNFQGTFLLVLRVWLGGLGGLGWKGGCPGNSTFNSKFPQPHPVRLGWVGAWGWLRACRGSSSAEKAVRVSSPQQDDTGGIRNSTTLKRSSRTTTELQRIWG